MTFTVYEFAVVDGQEWIMPADEADFERFWAMDGRVIHDWDPPVMSIDRDERTYSDFPWLGEHAPFLREPAVQALGPTLRAFGQLLPVRCEDVRLFNVTTVLDALDRDRSGIVSFDDGTILAIERHWFDARRIGTAEIFKLPMRTSSVYVTDGFVERVRQAGLRGVSFRTVWTQADA